jgi:hypothetical protein
MSDDPARYERARKRVEALRGFYIHLGVYVLVNAGLVLLNLITSPNNLWFYWPLLGWGIGLGAHALTVFGSERWFGPDWEERKIQELLDQEARQRASRDPDRRDAA